MLPGKPIRILKEMLSDRRAASPRDLQDIKESVEKEIANSREKAAEAEKARAKAGQAQAESQEQGAEAAKEQARSEKETAQSAEAEAEAEKERAEAESAEAEAEKEKAEAEKDMAKTESKSAYQPAAGQSQDTDKTKSAMELAKEQAAAQRTEAEAAKSQAEAQKAGIRLEKKRLKQEAKERMNEQMAGKEDEHKTPVLPVVLGVISTLFAIITYQASGTEGLLNIVPVLLFVCGTVILIASKGKDMIGWIMLIALAGLLLYKSGGIFSLNAIIPLVLLIACIIVQTVTKDRPNTIATIAIIIMISIAVFLLAKETVPYAIASIESQGGLQQTLEQTATDTATTTKEGISGLVDDLMASYKEQMAIAKGEKLQGNVDQSVKQDVGIEILPPLVENTKTVTRSELKLYPVDGGYDFIDGVGARIKGFDPKTPITVRANCNLQNRSSASSKNDIDMHPGPEQFIEPSRFSGTFFTKPVICRPVIPPDPELEGLPACGKYTVTITAQADELRTDAYMDNYLIDNQILKDSLDAYAQSKGELKQGDIPSAIAELFPTIGDYRSVSDKGAIKVVMITQKTPLIGIDEDTQLTLRVALENVMDGRIVNLSDVEVTIPESLKVMESGARDFCPGWEKTDGKIVLRKDHMNSISSDLLQLPKGRQKVLPACHLVPAGGNYEFTEPVRATFLAKVDYNYIVQDKFNIEIRDELGKPCRPGQEPPGK